MGNTDNEPSLDRESTIDEDSYKFSESDIATFKELPFAPKIAFHSLESIFTRKIGGKLSTADVEDLRHAGLPVPEEKPVKFINKLEKNIGSEQYIGLLEKIGEPLVNFEQLEALNQSGYLNDSELVEISRSILANRFILNIVLQNGGDLSQVKLSRYTDIDRKDNPPKYHGRKLSDIGEGEGMGTNDLLGFQWLIGHPTASRSYWSAYIGKSHNEQNQHMVQKGLNYRWSTTLQDILNDNVVVVPGTNDHNELIVLDLGDFMNDELLLDTDNIPAKHSKSPQIKL